MAVQVEIESGAQLARVMEHSALSPTASREDIVVACSIARSLGIRALAVRPNALRLAAMKLEGCSVLPVSVLAYPHGAALAEAKAYEAARLAALGAREIDMVIDIAAMKSHSYAEVAHDIAGVAVAIEGTGVVLKVIIETSALTDDEISHVCRIAVDSGAAFIQTSTGYGRSGATVEDVALIRRAVGSGAKIKAAGGVRTLADVRRMIVAGADTIGTSSTEKIFQELA